MLTKKGRLLSAPNRFNSEELPHYHFAHRPYNPDTFIIPYLRHGTINIAHRVGSSHLNHVQWEVTPVGHWFLIILIVPSKHVKRLIKWLLG